MINNKFTVVIPTRERANTLAYCLKTCIAQVYENFEILVSDNFSEDNTKNVVESFKDDRIKYINTGRRLSMSKNWEFALSHVKEGWVCFIGDDDGLLPGSIIKANEIINAQAKEADVLFWYNLIPWYFWGSEFGGTQNDNKILFKEVENCAPFKPKERVFQMASFDTPYETLPIIYHGFISIKLINAIKQVSANGLFFQTRIPDIYSTIPISIFAKHVVQCSEPLSINGVSNNSTGGSDLFKKNNGKTEKKFLSELNIPYHHSLPLTPDDKAMSNLHILSTDAFLHFFDNVQSEYTAEKEAYKEFVLLQLSQKIQKDNNPTYTHLTIKILRHNNLLGTDLTANKIFQKLNAKKKYFHYTYIYKLTCKSYNTKTIDDISKQYHKVVTLSLFNKLRYFLGKRYKLLKRYIIFLLQK